MITLIKSIIWVVGFVVVAAFVLDYFGYEINRDYFNESKSACLKKLDECKDEYIHQGTENAKCDISCVDAGKILLKKDK